MNNVFEDTIPKPRTDSCYSRPTCCQDIFVFNVVVFSCSFTNHNFRHVTIHN